MLNQLATNAKPQTGPPILLRMQIRLPGLIKHPLQTFPVVLNPITSLLMGLSLLQMGQLCHILPQNNDLDASTK